MQVLRFPRRSTVEGRNPALVFGRKLEFPDFSRAWIRICITHVICPDNVWIAYTPYDRGSRIQTRYTVLRVSVQSRRPGFRYPQDERERTIKRNESSKHSLSCGHSPHAGDQSGSNRTYVHSTEFTYSPSHSAPAFRPLILMMPKNLVLTQWQLLPNARPRRLRLRSHLLTGLGVFVFLTGLEGL